MAICFPQKSVIFSMTVDSFLVNKWGIHTFLSKKTEEKQKGVTMKKGKRKKGKKDRFFCKVEIRMGIV